MIASQTESFKNGRLINPLLHMRPKLLWRALGKVRIRLT